MTINTLPDGSPVALSEPISALIATIKTVLTEGRQRETFSVAFIAPTE